jgi:hypothetical protein
VVSSLKETKQKVKDDFFENLDVSDYKLHLFTLYSHFRFKIDCLDAEAVRSSQRSMDLKEVERTVDILNKMMNDPVFTLIKI